MAKFLVQRQLSEPLSVIGQLFIDGSPQCFTLEPAYAGDAIKPRAIPAGTYDLTIRQSQRFGRLMPHVENVPGFEGVLIHPGNYPDDTEGCLIVGTMESYEFVGHSVEAFNALFRKIQDALAEGPQTITYTDVKRTELIT